MSPPYDSRAPRSPGSFVSPDHGHSGFPPPSILNMPTAHAHHHHYEHSAPALDARARWRDELQSLKDKVDAMDRYLASMETRDAARGVKRRRPGASRSSSSSERVVPVPVKRVKRAHTSAPQATQTSQRSSGDTDGKDDGLDPGPPVVQARQLEDRLDSMYSEVDAVFRSVRAKPLGSGYRELQVRSRGTDGRMVRVLDARMMPSALTTTANWMWQHMLETSLGPNGASCSNLVSQDTIRAAISTTVLTPMGKGVFQGNIAMRRHVEPSRVVLLWNALLRPMEIDGLRMDELLVQHAEWVVVEPSDSDAPISRVQCCHVMTPNSPPPRGVGSLAYEHKMDVLTSFVRSAVASHMDASQRKMTRALSCLPTTTPATATAQSC
ncbi:hypothetical protein PINS_up012557 [Pythium insidiosum]|nr:hypothetical protein PINS_up012557 [Pythium insidiosum]